MTDSKPLMRVEAFFFGNPRLIVNGTGFKTTGVTPKKRIVVHLVDWLSEHESASVGEVALQLIPNQGHYTPRDLESIVISAVRNTNADFGCKLFVTRDRMFMLNPEFEVQLRYDVQLFRDVMSKAAETKSFASWQEAVKYCNYNFLVGYNDNWAITRRVELAELQTTALLNFAHFFMEHPGSPEYIWHMSQALALINQFGFSALSDLYDQMPLPYRSTQL